ncbi:MAG: DMT family transporter [Pseudomonadota bacterium]
MIAGIIWMVFAQLLFVVGWVSIKFLGSRIPLFEIIFFRAIVSVVILLPLTWWRFGSVRGKDYFALFLRSLFGFLAMAMAFYAMIKMDIGNAATLFNTLPIFVALLAPAILGETFSTGKLILVIIAFAGIGMILKPDPDILNGASIYALMAGLLGALAMLFVRKLVATDSTLIIILYFTAFTAVVAAPFAAAKFIYPTSAEWVYLLVIGICTTLGQIFMTRSYRYGHASTIAPFSYASVIGAYIVGFTIFNEMPDVWSVMGATVIIASGIGIMFTQPTTSIREEIRSAKVT